MMNLNFPGDIEYRKRLSYSGGKEKDASHIFRVSTFMGVIALSVATLLPTSAHADYTNHGPEPTLEDTSTGEQIRRNLQLQIDGILDPMAQRYVGILAESDYDVVDREGFIQFLQKFDGILSDLYDKGLLLGWDINNAMNVYSSWLDREQSPNDFMVFYDEFLNNYPTLRTELITQLNVIGISPIGIEASNNQEL